MTGNDRAGHDHSGNVRADDDRIDGTGAEPAGRPAAARGRRRALRPLPRPSEAELDALWARLLTELGFPPRCPRAACRRSRTCRPAKGVFACRIAHPEAFEAVKRGLATGRIAAASGER